MKDSFSLSVLIGPLLIFGPLFLWIFYNFGIREMTRIPEEIRHQRKLRQEQAERFREEHARKRDGGPVGGVRGANKTPLGLFAQAVTYIWFAAVIGFFASSPPYTYRAPGMAQIKLSLSHPGQRKVECRRRTREELAKMPANMRAAKKCPRERWPVYVEMELDGKAIMGESARPKGLAKDGPSIFYRAFRVTAGTHRLALSLRDKGDAGTDYRKQQEIELAPGQVLAIEFDASKGGFILQ